jgi:signal transduction histidine kinase/ActR/RegA family two-component response regulator
MTPDPNIYLIPPLLTLLISLWLASATFFKTGGLNQRNILFSAMFLLHSLPGFAFTSHYLIDSQATILSIERTIHFFYVYLPIVYLMFFHSLLEIKRPWMIITGFTCSVTFSFLTLTDFYFYGLYQYDWGYIARGGAAFMLFGAYAFIIIAYTFWIFLRSLRVETNPVTRRRNKYFLWAVGFSAFLTLCNIPAINGYDLYPAGNFSFIPLAVLGYAALKYRLLSFRDFAHQIAYWVATLVLILVPNLLIFLHLRHYLGNMAGPQSFILLLLWFASNFFYLVTFQPKINQVFHRTRINLEKAEALFLENILSLRTLERFEQEFGKFFSDHLLMPSCRLYLSTPSTGRFQNSAGDLLNVSAALQRWMVTERTLVDFNFLNAHPRYEPVSTDLGRLMAAMAAVYLIPVIREESLLALVFLPEKANQQPLTADEARFIDNISSAVAVSLANASMFQHINDLKDDLEKRTAELSREILQREQLEEQLSNARKMEALGTLAGGVAHDLNNILSGIVSYPELILDEVTPDSPLYQPLLDIKASGEKAAVVVEDLLTLARRGVPTTEVLDLNQIVTAYLASPEHAKLRSRHPEVSLETSLETSLPAMLGSSVHLSKTLMNLVANAFEAIPGQGRVIITTAPQKVTAAQEATRPVPPGDYILLAVVDNGIGIAGEDLRRIYEPFYTRKKMGRSGSGLGMAVVWGTVEDHKGIILADSKPGEGTSFEIYFPVIEAILQGEAEAARTEEYRGNGETILVIDDVENQRKIATLMLKKLGYRPRAVDSGEAAVEYLKKDPADLLLLDMIMVSGMDGLETYRKIVELYPGQKVVIASGYSETERVRQVQALGAGAYIKKPYLLLELGQALKAELSKDS